MTARGEDISLYILDAPDVIITNTLAFEAHQARIAFGMSIEQYEALPGDPAWIIEESPFGLSKAHVIAWNRMNNLIGRVQLKAAQKK